MINDADILILCLLVAMSIVILWRVHTVVQRKHLKKSFAEVFILPQFQRWFWLAVVLLPLATLVPLS